MNLDDFRNRAKNVKAPPLGPTADTPGAIPPIQLLVDRIRQEEQREQTALKKAAPLWRIAVACYLFVFLALLFDPAASVTPAKVVLYGFLALLFGINSALLLRKSRSLSRVDYAAPVREFLEKAEERYAFMPPAALAYALVGLVLLGVVAGFFVVSTMLPRYLGPAHRELGIAIYIAGFLLVTALGFFFTYQNWRRDKARSWREIREWRSQLERSEPEPAGGA